MKHLKGISNFLDTYKVLLINQDQISNLNISIIPNTIEPIRKIIPSNKPTNPTNKQAPQQGQIDLVQNSTRHSKKSLNQH